MFTLDATTKSIEVVLAGAVTTNQLPIVTSYVDKTTSTFTPASTTTATNSTTTVTIAAAPAAASTQREVHTINVYNADTVAATITIRENDNGTLRILAKVTLAVGDVLTYSHSGMWQVQDSNGQNKIAFTSFGNAGGDLTGTYPNPTVANDAVTNAKLANMATQTIKGRTAAGTGDPEDLTAAQAVAVLGASTKNSTIFIGNGTTFAAGNTYYSGGSVNWQTGDANLARSVMPFAGTISNLFAKCSSAPGGVQTFTFTVQKNSADTALTCTISGAAVSASDTTNSVSFNAGDDLQIKAVTSAGASASDASATFIISAPLT